MRLAAVLCLCAGIASAQECDRSESEQVIENAVQAGIIDRYEMYRSAPSIFVSRSDWLSYDERTQLGLVQHFECGLLGPGKIMGTIYVVSLSREILAEWKGLRRQLVRRDAARD